MATPFAPLETRKGLELLPAIDSVIVTWDVPVRYWPIFSSLVSVPEFFAKVIV